MVSEEDSWLTTKQVRIAQRAVSWRCDSVILEEVASVPEGKSTWETGT